MENIQSAWRRLWVVFRNDTPTVFLILAFATLRGAFSLVLPLGFQALIGQLMGGRLSASWWVLFFVVLLFSGLMVLFGLVMGLGMLVDNGIVVVENIYRLMDEGYEPFDAAKYGVGEVAWPIISSTATTLAAFLPLAFWPGMMGQFMKFLPITLIIVLGSSLFVAMLYYDT